MTDRITMNVPMRIRDVAKHELSALSTTLRVLSARGYGQDVLEPLQDDYEALERHLEATAAMAHQFRFGSSTPHHPEQVARFLVAQGWTPPEGTFLWERDPDKPATLADPAELRDVLARVQEGLRADIEEETP